MPIMISQPSAAPAGPGNGDVNGPASSTDNAVVVYDGTTGKVVKDSTLTVNALGLTFPAGSQLFADAGTDAAPGIAFAGDPGTGLYQETNGDGDIDFASAGVHAASLNAAGLTVVGDVNVGDNLVVPKTTGKGVMVDNVTPTFGWKDLLGRIDESNQGATKPTRATYNGAITQYRFAAGKEAYLEFHLPHDYLPGSDLFIHVHWSQISATNTGGTLDFKHTTSYASGYATEAFQTPVTKTFTSADAGSTQYMHHITEIPLSATTPTGGEQLDSDDLEIDGLILMTMEMDANNLTDSSAVTDPFIHYVDIHYQTSGVLGTKDKNAPFYS